MAALSSISMSTPMSISHTSNKDEEWFTMDMNETQLQNLVSFVLKKTDAEAILLTKQECINLLNENIRKGYNFKPEFPEIPSIILIDKIDVQCSKVVPINSISADNVAVAMDNINKDKIKESIKHNLSSCLIPPSLTCQSGAISNGVTTLKGLASEVCSNNGVTAMPNNAPIAMPNNAPIAIPNNALIAMPNNGVIAAPNSSTNALPAVVGNCDLKSLRSMERNSESQPQEDKSEFILNEAVKTTKIKNNELTSEIITRCGSHHLNDKKKILSNYKKIYFSWFEQFIVAFFKKYCGSNEEFTLLLVHVLHLYTLLIMLHG